MYGCKIVEQVTKKTKPMTGALKGAMIVFAALFVILGITVSQGFMLPGFLTALLYFVYDALSSRDYEYRLEDGVFAVDVILGKRYRKNAHYFTLDHIEVVAPARHEAVAKYRKDVGNVRLKKYDYTSYEPNVPYYTMIVAENGAKIKILLDLNEEMLHAMKSMHPDRVFTD